MGQAVYQLNQQDRGRYISVIVIVCVCSLHTCSLGTHISREACVPPAVPTLTLGPVPGHPGPPWLTTHHSPILSSDQESLISNLLAGTA